MSGLSFGGLLAAGLAYVLPSAVILHQMAAQRSAQLPSHLEIQGTLSTTGDTARQLATALGLPAQDKLSVAAHLSIAPGRCALELRGAQKLTATNDHGQVTFDPPGAAQASSVAGWLARLGCLPFLFHGEGGENDLEAAMRKAGGQFDETALTLESGDAAYVLGAGEDGRGKTGLVLQKRGLLPLRDWEGEGGSRVEVLFRDYRPVFHEGGFPTALVLRLGSTPVARFTAQP